MTSVMNILFLGTGTSTGVPQIGCSCAVCTSPDPRNRRLRSSIYVEAAGTRLLLDSSPDLRQQALRENITDVDAVLYTHAHVDHVGGFDDLRAFCWRRSGGLPMYASPMTVDALRTMYGWAFVPKPGRSGYVRPEPHEVTAPFRVGNVLATPLPVLHAGTVKRAPRWMQKNGLEWLYRIYREPGRLLRRYVKHNSLFVWYVLTGR